MILQRTAVACAALLSVLAATHAAAQDAPNPQQPPTDAPQADASPPVIPDTPAGDAVEQFLDLFNEGTLPTVREPAVPIMGPPAPGDAMPGDLRFTPQAEQRFPVAKIAEFMDERRSSFERYTLYAVKSVAVDRVAVLVQGEGDGSGWLLEVWTEREWPHRITQWQFVPNAEAARVPEVNSWADLAAIFDTYASNNTLTYAFAVLELPAHAAGPGNATTLTRLGSDDRFNLGAMSRYFVFDALVAQVNEGKYTWDQMVTVPASAHSLPPSPASQLPPTQEVPIAGLVQAALISRDNTACDALIELTTREAALASLQTRTGDEPRNTPFLDTMDLFKLKVGAQGSVVESFLAADEPTQAAMIDNEVAANTVPEEYFATWRIPQHVSTIGWFATAEDFAGLLADLWSIQGEDPIITGALFANAPMPSQGDEWEAAAFRAGLGEPGVLSAYWLLRRTDGRSFIVALAINDDDSLVAFEPLQPILIAATNYLAGLDRPE